MPTSSMPNVNTHRTRTGFSGAVSALFHRARPCAPVIVTKGDLAIPAPQERPTHPVLLKLTLNTGRAIVIHTAIHSPAARPALGILHKKLYDDERAARITQWLTALRCTQSVAGKARRAVEKIPGAVPVDVACAAVLLRTISLEECSRLLQQLFSDLDLAVASGDRSHTQTVARFRRAAEQQDPTRNLTAEFAVIESHIERGIPPEIACVSMLYPAFEKRWVQFIKTVAPDEDTQAEFDSDNISPLASPHSQQVS